MTATDDPLSLLGDLIAKAKKAGAEAADAVHFSSIGLSHAQRLGQPAPSLERLAGGDWPRYEALDGTRAEVAQNGSN